MILRRVLVACALGAGCREPKKAPVVHTIDGESTILPRLAAARTDAGATRTSLRTLDVKGKSRRYAFVEPASIAPFAPAGPDRRYPLILVFHGDGGDAMSFHDAWPFERATGSEAFLAYPDGVRSTWDLETTRDNADEDFVVAVVQEIASKHPIDRTHVFATGYSSGGFMANVLACHRPDLLRAIASNAGGAPYNQLEKWPNGYPKCPGQKPIATLALHGERDGSVTLDSGRFSAEYWAYVNGCKTDEMETTGYAECRAYRGCPPSKAVAFCSVPPLGHWVWSEASQAAWTFFQHQ